MRLLFTARFVFALGLPLGYRYSYCNILYHQFYETFFTLLDIIRRYSAIVHNSAFNKALNVSIVHEKAKLNITFGDYCRALPVDTIKAIRYFNAIRYFSTIKYFNA